MENVEGFWEDTEYASKIQREKSKLVSSVEEYQQAYNLFEEYKILEKFVLEEEDLESLSEALNVYEKLKKTTEDLEQKVLLSGDMDRCNAIVSINAGAGGTESCDWANMLYRMLTRWAEKSKLKVKTLDFLKGESAGIKSVTFIVEGEFAFGRLKSESGIHRLVRISPFDSNARRHTSFASIFVTPELDEEITIEILDKDLKIDVYRAGGAGGQSVNTTDSAVRITHLPSGIVVTCQNERSQLQNKLFAMKILKSRLYEKAEEERRAKLDAVEESKMEIGWGAQIRSYVLHPYQLVKDHRTGFEINMAENVLDGDLNEFMNSFLQWNAFNAVK
jgi:peptide chain release factor 2